MQMPALALAEKSQLQSATLAHAPMAMAMPPWPWQWPDLDHHAYAYGQTGIEDAHHGQADITGFGRTAIAISAAEPQNANLN